MSGPNPIHQSPRFPGAVGHLLRRTPFLDGTYRTFFGPGHRPNLVLSSYYPPTDWNRAGTILRVPQVAWLNAQVYKAEQPASWSYDYWTAERVDPSSGFDYLDRTQRPPAAYRYVSGPTPYTVINPAPVEQARLLSLFAQAKTTIEGLRPGKTFLQVIDWSSPPLWVGGPIAGGITPLYRQDGFNWIAAPPDGAADFFGTDFLQVYAGNFWVNTPTFQGLFFIGPGPGELDPTELNATSFWIRPNSRLVSAYPFFRRHATLLYSAEPGWPPNPVPFDPTEAFQYGPRLPGDGPPPPYSIPFAGTPINPFTSALFDQAALIEPNTVHVGPTSAITASGLIAKIADHFRFHPITGADLG